MSLADAINRVGINTYGADWCGNQANALYKLTSQIRYHGPRSDSEHALVASEARARRQHDDILRTLRSYFRGTPPSFEDAVRAVVMSNADGRLYDLPPQTWINDQMAWIMLGSGRALGGPTHPAGVILIPEATFAPAPTTIARPPAEPDPNQPDAKRVWQASNQETAAASGETRAEPAEADMSDSATNSAMDGAETEFVVWMTDEKRLHGSYPPRDPPRMSDMPHSDSWRGWAQKHDINYAIVESWVTKHELSNPRGRRKNQSN